MQKYHVNTCLVDDLSDFFSKFIKFAYESD